MIEIYGATIDRLPDVQALLELAKTEFYRPWMEKHHEPSNEGVLRTGLGALWLLQKAGIDGVIVYDKDGRPHLDGSDVDFNITHTDTAVFCAVSRGDGRVGIDAERVDRVSTLRSMALAQRWFADGEKRVFAKSPIPETFLSIWTKKEALVKWTGDGMRALREEDVFAARGKHGVIFTDYRTGDTAVTLCQEANATAPKTIQMI